MKRIPKLSVVKQAVSVIPIYLSSRRWSVPLLLWSIGVGILIGLAPTNAAAQQSTIRLGETFNGLNLNLIFPVTTAANKLYYHMDHNGNGNASGEGDFFNHNSLDLLINTPVADTIATQPGGHDGSKDKRSLIVGSYTLVLPTVAELQALYADRSNRIPPNWSSSPYHAADRVDENENEHRVFNLDNGVATDVSDGVRHPIAFQVIVVTPGSPAAPTGLTATPERESLIVRWTPVPDKDNGGAAITQYTASATANGQPTQTCTVPGATASTCTIQNLAGRVAYTITVTATNSVGTASSTDIIATPLAGFPDAPTDVILTPGDEQIIVTWSHVPAANDGGAPITAYTASATAPGEDTRSCVANGATATTCAITGLINGIQYSVVVTAANSAGNNSPESAVVMVIPGLPTAAPTAVTALPTTDAALRITWTAVPDADNDGAAITQYTATATADGQPTRSCTANGATATTCDITDLSNNVAYDVIVVATNAYGNSPDSDAARAVPGVPAAPTDVILIPGNEQIIVTWTPVPAVNNGGAPVTSYKALPFNINTDGTLVGHLICTVPGATANTCAITGLINGNEYRVVVRATNSRGDSIASASVLATPMPSLPLMLAPITDQAYFVGQSVSLTLPISGGGTGMFTYTLTPTVNIPAGLTFNSTERTLTGTPTATAATVLTYTATDTDAVAISQTFSITITVAATITWTGGNFVETAANDGAVMGVLTATLTGDTFVARPDDATRLPSGSFITGGGIPSSLNYVVTRTGPTVVTVTLSGNADSHTNADDLLSGSDRISISFGDFAFTNFLGVQVANRERIDLTIDFNDPDPLLLGAIADQTWLIGQAISLTLPEATGGTAPLSYALTRPGGTPVLPSSVTFNAAARTISGTPNITFGGTTGTSLVWTVTDSASTPIVAMQTFSVIVNIPAPTGVTAIPADDASLIIRWTPVPAINGGAEITTYTATATATGQPTQTCTATGAITNTCTISGLTNGTEYSITVVATNNIGIGIASEPVRAVPGVPAAPTDVTLTPGDEQIIVTWTPVPAANNGGAEIISYTADPFPDGGGLLGHLTCTVLGATANTCGITGLTNGIRYRVIVRAKNIRGESIASASVLATPAVSPTPILVPIADQTYPVGQEVSFILPKSGGGTSITYTLTPADNIPAGLTFTPADRSLTGIPTATTVAALTYTVTDANNATASQTFSITITPPDPLVFDISVIPAPDTAYTYTFNTLITPLTLPPATGGVGELTYTLTADIPAGLTFSPTERTLTGIPTTGSSTTDLNYVVTDSAAMPNASTLTFSVTVIAGDQQSTLTLGIADDINLNLIFPIITAEGKLYYYLDHDGNGDSTGDGDRRTHDQLDTLLNKGDDTIDTQPSGHDGGDDERSASAGAYTLVLPTVAEMRELRTDQDDTNPLNWPDLRYHTASRTTSTQHSTYSFSEDNAEPTPDSTERSVVFQVIARTPTAPAAPTSVTVATADSSLTVTWTPVPNIDNGGAEISTYTATATDITDNIFTCTATGATANTCTITGLTNGTEYSITVVATNRIGSSVASAAATATPVGVPAAPIGVSAIPADSSLTVTWTPVPNIDNGGAEISTYTSTVTDTTDNNNIFTCTAAGAMANTCIIIGLTNDIEYSITVVATNRVGDSPASTAITATPTTAPITESLLFRIKVFLEGAQ